ncbi:MAG TPA: hypothetical protein PKW07_01780 [Syntrophorhabdaceae bacterium]|nr:hypothetical protein [Syntrophorhabdaceae bacterium]
MQRLVRISSSFRDPSGYVFLSEGRLYRIIFNCYRDNYEHLMDSGLYDKLTKENLLINHEEACFPVDDINDVYKVIRPESIDFISYPYEWCFSQLKDAALLTLKIQKIAFEHGMTLKDASAYNVQFKDGKPILIDTLSFEKYREGRPWIAYKQFCQHFLAPLVLMSLKDVRLNELLRSHIDGIPLDLTSSLLPYKTIFNYGILFHIHLHARSQKRFEKKPINREKYRMGRNAYQALMENLESLIKKIHWKPEGTEWADYYHMGSYSKSAMEHKSSILLDIIERFDPGVVLDLGANDGFFSRLVAGKSKYVISADADPACVEKNYLICKDNVEKKVLPILIDLTNPSPSLGWQNLEREAFFKRLRVDTVIALALIHHLAISNNISLDNLADFFRKLGRFLVIEFIPKTDSQVKRLLSSREDIFFKYNQEEFERQFFQYFRIKERFGIIDSHRTIYFMERKD